MLFLWLFFLFADSMAANEVLPGVLAFSWSRVSASAGVPSLLNATLTLKGAEFQDMYAAVGFAVYGMTGRMVACHAAVSDSSSPVCSDADGFNFNVAPRETSQVQLIGSERLVQGPSEPTTSFHFTIPAIIATSVTSPRRVIFAVGPWDSQRNMPKLHRLIHRRAVWIDFGKPEAEFRTIAPSLPSSQVSDLNTNTGSNTSPFTHQQPPPSGLKSSGNTAFVVVLVVVVLVAAGAVAFLSRQVNRLKSQRRRQIALEIGSFPAPERQPKLQGDDEEDPFKGQNPI